MRRGLVIGKFMPLHYGHIHLIDFALEHCDFLEIALVVKPTDDIPSEVRQAWLSWLKESRKRFEVVVVDEPLPQTATIEADAAKVWTDYFAERFAQIDVIFSSEDYGTMLAEAMGIDHVYYDAERRKTCISGSEIRKNPAKYLAYVPEMVAQYLLEHHQE